MAYVWVFNGSRNRFPSAVFVSRDEAERWIASTQAIGTLTKYPLGISAYDWAVQNGHFTPSTPDHSTPAFISNFSSASQEHYHFEPDE